MNKIKLLLPILLCFLLFAQCENKDKKENNELPPSIGGSGDVIVVIDTLLWNSPVGTALKKAFRAPIPGLPDDEAFFTLRRVSPFQYNNFLQRHRNLIFVTAFEDDTPASNRLKGYFTEESRQKIAADSSIFYITQQNQNAQNQFIMYLFGQTREQLINNIQKNAASLREQLHKAEIKRITQEIYAKGENKQLARQLAKKYNFSIRIPQGYQQAKSEEQFVWLRRYANVDKNIVIAFKEYTSQDMFNADSIIAWRDEIGRNNIFGSGQPDTTTYMMTQDYIPVESREVNFNGHYAIELRGLWKLKSETMGGTFISYAFVDEASRRMYYIEGFLYSPGEDKRNNMRELEAILKTFKSSGKNISAR
jgi:hypothetical protein